MTLDNGHKVIACTPAARCASIPHSGRRQRHAGNVAHDLARRRVSLPAHRNRQPRAAGAAAFSADAEPFNTVFNCALPIAVRSLKGSTMSNKPFVGNLSFDSGQSDLQEQFSSFGQVF